MQESGTKIFLFVTSIFYHVFTYIFNNYYRYFYLGQPIFEAFLIVQKKKYYMFNNYYRYCYLGEPIFEAFLVVQKKKYYCFGENEG